jgi:hypothetical protein
MDLEEVGWGGRVWTELAQDQNRWRALVNKPSGSIKWGILEWMSDCWLLKMDFIELVI